MWWLVWTAAALSVAGRAAVAQLNRPPQFMAGGDMARFALPEDAAVGAPVYRLQGSDPEGAAVTYSISGEHLNVDRASGVVTLVRPLDRERQDLLEVIISITDEAVDGTEPNTVSLRRVIPVLDVNDNPPQFHGRPYAFAVPESTKVGTILYSNISVSDKDIGVNAELVISCVKSEACRMFSVQTEKVGEGQYMGSISLAHTLDYESWPSHNLVLQASDSSALSLTASANIIIDVTDVQDQAPMFSGAPYSATIQENTPPGQSVVRVQAQDGDLGESRPVSLTIEDDDLGYFQLEADGSGQATVVTSSTPIDREHPSVLQNGGVYTFKIKATELINNELPGDFSYESVTVVITDVDDQDPLFNQLIFYIDVAEDVGIGTPLPGLNMVVNDGDVGDNAHYSLSLRSTDSRVARWFRVEPTTARGRTPLVVRVQDNSGIDFDKGVTEVSFTIVAHKQTPDGETVEASSSDVIVNILDANDNSPVFGNHEYSYTIQEDLPPGSLIAKLTAKDRDSDEFGQIRYTLRGFGMDKFGTDPVNGNLYLISKVDYEKQKSYSLTLEAKDGGGRITTVNILVHLANVNDNAPSFEQSEYRRTVREGATTFQPQFFVKATDADEEGRTALTYRIVSTNSDVLTVDGQTGEVKMVTPVSSSHTSRGQYELVVRAADDGVPPLHGDAHVFVRVGVPGNQRPVFRGVPYNITVPENTPPDSAVIKVRATDPDGPDSLVEYRIATGADNFYVNSSTGVVSVTRAAILDPEVTGMTSYELVVLAVDSGSPLRETAQATVTVNILDVNNKPPKFPLEDNYVRHISERTPIGEKVLNVQASDPDLNAQLVYSLVDVRAADKTGVALRYTNAYSYKRAFRIDPQNGDIIVNSTLDHQAAAVIILRIEAKDVKAVENIDEQHAEVEVTLYIQAYNELNPRFTVGSWSPVDPTIRVAVAEEQPVGTTVLQLTAVDSPTEAAISHFTSVTPLPVGFALQSSGLVELTKTFDYEEMDNKTFSFRVHAVSDDRLRKSEALVLLTIQDINDHAPQFIEQIYQASVEESAPNGTIVMHVNATDGDHARTPEGFGDVRYSLSGEHSSFFTIDNFTGDIKVSETARIDREAQAVLRLIVTAVDTPQGGPSQRKTSVPIELEVEDVNDNAPTFPQSHYSAVVLENVAAGTSVLNLTAGDPDLGAGGRTTYELIDHGDATGLFVVDSKSGAMKTAKALTGKGRSDPYSLTVRALDHGVPSLFTDVSIKLFIGDVVSNDGIPAFIHPTVDEMAYISENSSVGSPVFRVVASDPDDPNSPEGQLKYSFLNDGSDTLAFNIDSETGLITLKQTLDREAKDNYWVVLVAQDMGAVPQQATRVLHITVTDVDDHKPTFKRTLDEAPVEMAVAEESEIGTDIGTLQALDQDIGENANIGYLITYGNEDNLFTLNQTEDNRAVLLVSNRLDRELAAQYLITVKCFKRSLLPISLRKPYNRQDPSERQVLIRIIDIDDNLPEFSDNNITIGVRVNVPIDTLLLTMSATDLDSEAESIVFNLESIKFSRFALHENKTFFSLDNTTGEIRTATSMIPFSDGFFTLSVSAMNSPNRTYAIVKVFVVRERGLLKFVFGRPPADVRQSLPQFRQEMERVLAVPAALNVYDTQFHAKADGSLDFSSTSSCFQLVGDHGLDLKEMENLLQPGLNVDIDKVYATYNVQDVQRCVLQVSKATMTWAQLSVLAIAAFIGLASLVSSCVLCFSYSRWQRFR